jgi:hypothetical protein
MGAGNTPYGGGEGSGYRPDWDDAVGSAGETGWIGSAGETASAAVGRPYTRGFGADVGGGWSADGLIRLAVGTDALADTAVAGLAGGLACLSGALA